MCGGGYTPQPTPRPSGNQPRYAVYADGYGWLTEMEGLKETDGGSDNYGGVIGAVCTYISCNGVGRYRVFTSANG